MNTTVVQSQQRDAEKQGGNPVTYSKRRVTLVLIDRTMELRLNIAKNGPRVLYRIMNGD